LSPNCNGRSEWTATINANPPGLQPYFPLLLNDRDKKIKSAVIQADARLSPLEVIDGRARLRI
jgi:hypothetical protein